VSSTSTTEAQAPTSTTGPRGSTSSYGAPDRGPANADQGPSSTEGSHGSSSAGRVR
jgi:hypothetical protein